MLKSSKLVLGFGILLGLSVAVLPLRSFAAVRFDTSVDTVSATVRGMIGFTASPAANTADGYSYDTTNNAYTGTFTLGDSTENIGTTTYTVLCNYRSAVYTGAVYDASTFNPSTGAISQATGTVNGVANTPFTGVNTDCSNGWYVSATPTYTDDSLASLRTASSGDYYAIKSTSGTIGSLAANWAMKVTALDNSAVPYADGGAKPSPTSGYTTLHAVPNAETNVISGNTFQNVSSVANTYVGTQSFSVAYGFAAGAAAAGTYSGGVTYTLYLNNGAS